MNSKIKRIVLGIAFLALSVTSYNFGLDCIAIWLKAVSFVCFLASSGIGLFLLVSPVFYREVPSVYGQHIYAEVFPVIPRNVAFVIPLAFSLILGGIYLFTAEPKVTQVQINSIQQDFQVVKQNAIEGAQEPLEAAASELNNAQQCYDQKDFVNCRRHLECAIINIASAKNGGGVSVEEIKALGL